MRYLYKLTLLAVFVLIPRRSNNNNSCYQCIGFPTPKPFNALDVPGRGVELRERERWVNSLGRGRRFAPAASLFASGQICTRATKELLCAMSALRDHTCYHSRDGHCGQAPVDSCDGHWVQFPMPGLRPSMPNSPKLQELGPPTRCLPSAEGFPINRGVCVHGSKAMVVQRCRVRTRGICVMHHGA